MNIRDHEHAKLQLNHIKSNTSQNQILNICRIFQTYPAQPKIKNISDVSSTTQNQKHEQTQHFYWKFCYGLWCTYRFLNIEEPMIKQYSNRNLIYWKLMMTI